MALVDRAVRRVLKLKFRLGLFENPYVDVDRAASVVHSQANQDLALRAGREGIVLLKNEKGLLPLKKNAEIGGGDRSGRGQPDEPARRLLAQGDSAARGEHSGRHQSRKSDRKPR